MVHSKGARHVPATDQVISLHQSSVSVPIPVAPEKKSRAFEQRNLKVPKSARYAIMGSLGAELTEVWIVCHGHGQLARRFLSRFLPLERRDRLFTAPEALSRYYLSPPQGGPHPPDAPVGASWMTVEDRELEMQDYVRYLDLLYDEIFSIVDRAKVQLWLLASRRAPRPLRVGWLAAKSIRTVSYCMPACCPPSSIWSAPLVSRSGRL